jgi:hypothetical protein
MPNYRLPTPKVFNPRTMLSQGRQSTTKSRPPLAGIQGPSFPGAPQSYARPPLQQPTASRYPGMNSGLPPANMGINRPTVTAAMAAPRNNFEHAASMMGPKSGVTPQQVQAYMRPEVNRGQQLTEVQAAAAAAADNIWAEEARRLGILTGRAWEDDLIWREHWAFNQGLSNRDPLLTGHPEALKEIEARAMEALEQQRLNLYNALNRERKMTRRSEAGGPAYEPPYDEVIEGELGPEQEPEPEPAEPPAPTEIPERPEDKVGKGNTVNVGWGGESEY